MGLDSPLGLFHLYYPVDEMNWEWGKSPYCFETVNATAAVKKRTLCSGHV